MNLKLVIACCVKVIKLVWPDSGAILEDCNMWKITLRCSPNLVTANQQNVVFCFNFYLVTSQKSFIAIIRRERIFEPKSRFCLNLTDVNFKIRHFRNYLRRSSYRIVTSVEKCCHIIFYLSLLSLLQHQLAVNIIPKN